MIRTQISLDKMAYREFRARAKRLGISFAEYCRRSLAAYGQAEPAGPSASGDDKPWMKYVGMFDSGDPDSSLTVDEVVYGRDRP